MLIPVTSSHILSVLTTGLICVRVGRLEHGIEQVAKRKQVHGINEARHNRTAATGTKQLARSQGSYNMQN